MPLLVYLHVPIQLFIAMQRKLGVHTAVIQASDYVTCNSSLTWQDPTQGTSAARSLNGDLYSTLD